MAKEGQSDYRVRTASRISAIEAGYGLVHARLDRGELLGNEIMRVAQLDDGILQRMRNDTVRIRLQTVHAKLPTLTEIVEQRFLGMPFGRKNSPEPPPPADDVVGGREPGARPAGCLHAARSGLTSVQRLTV